MGSIPASSSAGREPDNRKMGAASLGWRECRKLSARYGVREERDRVGGWEDPLLFSLSCDSRLSGNNPVYPSHRGALLWNQAGRIDCTPVVVQHPGSIYGLHVDHGETWLHMSLRTKEKTIKKNSLSLFLYLVYLYSFPRDT